MKATFVKTSTAKGTSKGTSKVKSARKVKSAKNVKEVKEVKSVQDVKTPDFQLPLEPYTFGTYYPVSAPNGLACFILFQRESGRWLIIDLTDIHQGLQDIGGGSYNVTFSIKLRTVTAKNLTRFTGWKVPAIEALQPAFDRIAHQFK